MKLQKADIKVIRFLIKFFVILSKLFIILMELFFKLIKFFIIFIIKYLCDKKLLINPFHCLNEQFFFQYINEKTLEMYLRGID